MIITKRHLSRRTVLKGMGVTAALPFLDAMAPAATRAGEDGGERAGPVRRHRDGPRCRWQLQLRAAEQPLVAGRDRTVLRSLADLAGAARADSRLRDDRQQHRRPHGGGLHDAGDRRRSLPRELRLPHPGASQADDGIGSVRGDVVRPDLRARVRSGHGVAVDAARDRDGRLFRRLRVRLLVRVHRRDQLGVAERAAADAARPARRLRHDVRRRRDTRGTREAAARGPEHPRHDRRRRSIV